MYVSVCMNVSPEKAWKKKQSNSYEHTHHTVFIHYYTLGISKGKMDDCRAQKQTKLNLVDDVLSESKEKLKKKNVDT